MNDIRVKQEFNYKTAAILKFNVRHLGSPYWYMFRDPEHRKCGGRPFAKTCIEYRNQVGEHIVKKCEQCQKAERWLNNCKRADGKFSHLWQINKNKYVCSTHFYGGDGPTPTNPDPIPATASNVQVRIIYITVYRLCRLFASCKLRA